MREIKKKIKHFNMKDLSETSYVLHLKYTEIEIKVF
jgi:hypothetical protein